MNAAAPIMPALEPLSPDQVNRLLWHSRQMFSRTVSAWAGDVLALRRTGHGEPLWQPATRRHARKAA